MILSRKFLFRILQKSRSSVCVKSLSTKIPNRFVNEIKMPALDRNYFILPNNTPFCALDCQKAFDSLSEKERLYAHYLAQASWYGSLIVLHQTSPESPLIFILLRKILRHHSVADLKHVASTAGMTDDEFKAFLIYASGIFANMGNYKGFGDTKIILDIDQKKFENFVRNTTAYKKEKSEIDFLLSEALPKIYSIDEHVQRLGLWNKGVTTYHSSNIDENDSSLIDRYMKSTKMEGWNTRLFKSKDPSSGKTVYNIRLASIEEGDVRGPEEFEGSLIKITRGDYSPLLRRTNYYLSLAKENALNETERNMLEKYIEHFKTGDLNSHKDGSRFWIQDKGPVVESYIGFIENYRDPVGVRSEFEGFVAVVNRSMSEKFGRLVNNAENLLSSMPWDRAFEKDKFLRPDFTSLDVLAFGGSGIPAGINIPNYDEIRQNEGFKNVSLGNVIAAIPDVKIIFLTPEDQAIFKRYHTEAFEVQVGLHELIGHGSGKLFYRNKDGTFNFNVEEVKDMETGGKITSWYEEGETWSTKFGSLSSAYEECRAEAVGYFLSTFPEVLKIFGHEGTLADDVKYVNWLSEIRAGLLGLEFYSPEKNAWGQAHSHARFVLLMVALEAGNGFVEIKEFDNADDGKADLLFSLDRAKIDSVGRPAIAAFLKKLQLYKSTGDFEKGKALFDQYSTMTPTILHWRDIAIARRQPRRILVLPNTILQDGGVVLKSYLETPEGAVLSNVERYVDDNIEKEIMELWNRDKAYFEK